jgi:hypothetical protein
VPQCLWLLFRVEQSEADLLQFWPLLHLNLLFGLFCCISMSMVWNLMIPGIAVGLLGIAGVVMAWPVYQKVVRKEAGQRLKSCA